MTDEKTKPQIIMEGGFYEPYAHFARLLRAWLVAYGIGSIAIFTTNDSISKAISKSGGGYFVVVLLFVGILCQIIGALLYKTSMWYLYIGELHHEFQTTRLYRFSDWLSEQYWPEAVLDIITLGVFIWATLWVSLIVFESYKSALCS